MCRDCDNCDTQKKPVEWFCSVLLVLDGYCTPFTTSKKFRFSSCYNHDVIFCQLLSKTVETLEYHQKLVKLEGKLVLSWEAFCVSFKKGAERERERSPFWLGSAKQKKKRRKLKMNYKNWTIQPMSRPFCQHDWNGSTNIGIIISFLKFVHISSKTQREEELFVPLVKMHQPIQKHIVIFVQYYTYYTFVE